jgi:tetratricopeptide (TPR) repeat protein
MPEVTLEQAPRKARDMFDKGFSALERDNLEYAMDMFMAALELEPRLLRARRFLRAAQMKKMKGKKPNPISSLFSSAKGLPGQFAVQSALKKQPQKALQEAEKLLRIDPLNISFLNLYAQAAEAADLPEAAVMTFEVAREHHSKDDKLLVKLANLYLEVNETHKARECFEAIARLRPNDPAAIKALKDAAALDTMKSGGWTGAKDYRDVLKDKKESALLEQQAKAVKSAKGVDALIEEMQAKVASEPANINHRRALADLYTRAERYDEALKVLEESFEQTGGADPELARAISSTKVRKFDAEIARRQAAGQTAEAQAMEQQKMDFLLHDAEERVRRYPNDLQFKFDLGTLLYERQRYNEAIEQLQRARSNPQRRIQSMYYLALSFKAKQQLDLARDQLEKAASELRVMDDTKKDIVYELGQIAEAMGQTEPALGHYKEIYSVDIGYKDVAQKIEQAYQK